MNIEDIEDRMDPSGEFLDVDSSDMELEHQTQQAMAILSSSGVTVENMLRHLPSARAQVVVEHYGAQFMDDLKRRQEACSERDSC